MTKEILNYRFYIVRALVVLLAISIWFISDREVKWMITGVIIGLTLMVLIEYFLEELLIKEVPKDGKENRKDS